MTGSIKHATLTGAPADSTALVDGPAWDANHTFTLTSSDVGLGNVDNTSDVNKPVSTAQAAADSLRVLKAGDTMTGALTITPTAASNGQAAIVTQSTPNGGSVAGPINLNQISVTAGTQTVTGTVDSLGQIADRTTGLQVNYTATGGSANHFAIDGLVKATGTNGGIVGVVGGTRTETGGVSTGNMWGVIGYAEVAGNSTFNQSMIGVDAEVGIATGSTARDRIGVGSVAFGSVAATTTDASFLTYLDTGEAAPFNGAAPFKIGWYLSANYLGAATFPIATSGDVIKADTGTITNFVNAHTLTVSGNILDFPNVLVTGSGSLRLFNTNSAGALVVSPNSGVTNTSFQVDNSIGQGNGVYIFTTAAGSGANITTISTTTNEPLKINAKGSGTIDLGGTSTGGVTVHGGLLVAGSSSGAVTISAPAAAGSNTLTLPAGTTDFSSTGGTSKFVKQASVGAALTVVQPTSGDILGTTTNDNATAGNIGEYIQSFTNTTLSATVTISNASPAVITQAGHGMTAAVNNYGAVNFTTTGGLPTGLSTGTTYYITIVDANTYKVATSVANAIAGTFVNTSSAGSGVHTAVYTTANLTTATTVDLCGISLTAGDWDVVGTTVHRPAGTTTVQTLATGPNTTTATLPTADRLSSFQFGSPGITMGANFTMTAPTSRFSLSSTTTIFLTLFDQFGTSTMAAQGFLHARRVR